MYTLIDVVSKLARLKLTPPKRGRARRKSTRLKSALAAFIGSTRREIRAWPDLSWYTSRRSAPRCSCRSMILIRFGVHPRAAMHALTRVRRKDDGVGGGGRAEIPAAERSVLRMRRIRWFGIVARGKRSVNGRTQVERVERERASESTHSLARMLDCSRAAPCHRQVDPPSSCTPPPSCFFSPSLSLSLSLSPFHFSFLERRGEGFAFDIFWPANRVLPWNHLFEVPLAEWRYHVTLDGRLQKVPPFWSYARRYASRFPNDRFCERCEEIQKSPANG